MKRICINLDFKYLLFSACLFASCRTADLGEVPSVNIEYQGATRASEWFDSYQVFELKASCTDAVIKTPTRILFSSDRIYVLDWLGKKVLAFDRQGNFITSTSKLKGKGHNEYVSITDATLDEKTGDVYMFCDNPYGLMVLDKDLHLKKFMKTDYYLSEIAFDGKNLYGLRSSHDGDNLFELVMADMKKLSDLKTLVTSDKGIRGLYSFGKQITVNGGGIHACLPFDNVIYELGKGKATPRYVMDFGEKTFVRSSKDMSVRKFDNENKSRHWMIQNIACSDSLMMFNTNLSDYFCMDLNTMKCIAHHGMRNDFLGFSNSQMIPTQGLGGAVVYETRPEELLGYADYARKHPGKEEYDSRLMEAAKDIKNTGSTIIIVWKLRK